MSVSLWQSRQAHNFCGIRRLLLLLHRALCCFLFDEWIVKVYILLSHVDVHSSFILFLLPLQVSNEQFILKHQGTRVGCIFARQQLFLICTQYVLQLKVVVQEVWCEICSRDSPLIWRVKLFDFITDWNFIICEVKGNVQKDVIKHFRRRRRHVAITWQ